MLNPSLVKNRKFQIAAIIVLTAAVILFSLLTDFPEGDTQGALRNKRFGPTVQPQQTQNQNINSAGNNINNPLPIQGFDSPQNGNLIPTSPNTQPITNNFDSPQNGN